MRPAALALLSCGLAALACSPESQASCPGDAVAAFHFKGRLVTADDSRIAALDPVPTLPDCTPDPFAAELPPIQYPRHVAFDATLAVDPATSAAALCRPNGAVYSGQETGTRWAVSAEAEPAVLCKDLCAARLTVVIAGDVTADPSGDPAAFRGILVEVLTASRGDCSCLPPVPGSDPPALACAGRYALTGWAD